MSVVLSFPLETFPALNPAASCRFWHHIKFFRITRTVSETAGTSLEVWERLLWNYQNVSDHRNGLNGLGRMSIFDLHHGHLRLALGG